MIEGGVAEVARVLRVVRNRRRAAQLVADGLVNDCDLDTATFESQLNLVLDLSTEINLRDAYVALRVAVNVLKLCDLRGVEAFDQSLRQKHDAVPSSERATLDDRALDDSADVRERDAFAPELFGDDRARRARGLADGEREVSCGPPHRHAQVPATRSLRVLHQTLHQLHADVPRRLEAESRDREREPEVVVNRLRHERDADCAFGRALDCGGASDEVVAADCDERLDVEFAERGDGVLQGRGVARDVGARSAEAYA